MSGWVLIITIMAVAPAAPVVIVWDGATDLPQCRALGEGYKTGNAGSVLRARHARVEYDCFPK